LALATSEEMKSRFARIAAAATRETKANFLSELRLPQLEQSLKINASSGSRNSRKVKK
jgi:hypothetical protein